MVMHFLYSVGKDKMCEAWEEGLEANMPNASAEVKTAFKTLCSWMEDIPKGKRLVLTYVPGTGTTVEVNGKKKGTLARQSGRGRDRQHLDRPEAGHGRRFQERGAGK